MFHSSILFFSLCLTFSFLPLLPVNSQTVPTLPCYSSFQFVPGNYSTCVSLKNNGTLAWSLSSDKKYLSGLYTTLATKPGGWVALGFSLIDATFYMRNAAIVSCHNSVNGPIMYQLYTSDSLGYTVAIDNTKTRLNVTGKKCSIETTNNGTTTFERIYIQFNITLKTKFKYVNLYAKGTCTALGQGVGGTAMNQHSVKWTDQIIRDFSNTTFSGRVEPPRQPPAGPPPPSLPIRPPPPPPPTKTNAPPPKINAPPIKTTTSPPKINPPPPKTNAPPPKINVPPPIPKRF